MTPPPDPAEWDFRSLPEHELSACIWWEYLRESKVNSKAAVQWLRTSPEPDALAGPFNLEVCTLLLEHPGFPKPWLSIHRPKFKGYGATFQLRPLKAEIQSWRDRDKRFPKLFSALSDDFWNNKFSVEINFMESRNLEVIEGDLIAWLRQEAKKRCFTRPAGRKAALPWHLLKNLAALRLGNLSFGDAQSLLHARQKYKSPVRNPSDVLPIFAQPNKWTEARKAAALLIQKQEFAINSPGVTGKDKSKRKL